MIVGLFSSSAVLFILCAFGIASGITFLRMGRFKGMNLAYAAYLLAFVGLSYAYWKASFAGVRDVAVAGGVLFMFLGGFLLSCAWNGLALWCTAVHYLGVIGRAGMSDDQIVVRKTYDRAEGAESRGDYEGAAELYRKETDSDPTDREAHRRLAEVLLKMGSPREAVEELRSVLALSKEEEARCAAAFRLAEVLQDEMGDREAAADLYRMVLQDYPDSKYAGHARSRLEQVGQD